ncbi:unnamed protein product [Soboliphyme baturini]|uniref:FF domain-containing protein n=1 Tax=Soboliphyme baturini TaxID=241478 RepID=A0A183IX13_9BILA|nr:unnamed protein product [Soboliphyme baturini]
MFRSSFSDFASKYGRDSRFKGIEKMRERETMFDDYVREVRRKEREEKTAVRNKQKTEFVELLKEQDTIRKHSKWSEIKKTIDSDARYRQVDSSSLKEDWFKEYCKTLTSENSVIINDMHHFLFLSVSQPYQPVFLG